MKNTLIEHLVKRSTESATQIAVQYKEKTRWIRYRWQDYYSLVESIGAALLHLDIKANDRIAVISNTRSEWPVTDLAIMSIGAVTVPIYPNNLEEDVEFIINDSEVKVLFLENHEQYKKWKSIQKNCPSVQHIILFDPEPSDSKHTTSWSELIQKGREALRNEESIYNEQLKKLMIDDISTILYTSGTTGRPKGVVLTHRQIMSEITDIFSIVNVNSDDISLTFLPYSHILGRVEAWGSIYAGYTLAFAENIDKIKQNLKEVRPTFLIAVPRIFEKIYAGILSQAENSKIKSKIFNYCLNIGKSVSHHQQRKESLSPVLSLQLETAKRLVFKRIHDQMGGRLRFAVSGGAPLGAEIAQFFHGIGILICEGYGLTETTAGITFNTPLHYKFGTVGKPFGDVQIRFAEDGEILVRSQKVMKEYYNNPQATAEVFDGEFLKTGDIGHLDEDGYLVITDRKKDLIKTAGGKYVAPQKLENLLKRSPYISNVLIHGDQKKYIVALITLNANHVLAYAKRKNMPQHNYSELIQSPPIYTLIKDVVAEANTELASFESIKKFSILLADFTVESGELTPSLKVKRRHCDQKYAKEIAELYS